MSTVTAPVGASCADCHVEFDEGEEVVYVNDDLVHVACEGPALAALVRGAA